MKTSDLTAAEQSHVKAALAFLHARCGDWETLAKALRVGRMAFHRPITPMLAFRVARLAKVGVDEVLTGKYPPPGVCPHCGAVRTEAAAQ
jgi:hypothetical protein